MRGERAPVQAHVCDQLPTQWRRSLEPADDAGALNDGDGEDIPGAGAGGPGEEP